MRARAPADSSSAKPLLVLAAGYLALERSDDPRQLLVPATRRLARPRLALRGGLLRCLAGRRGPFGRPSGRRHPRQRRPGVVDLRKRLVGEAGERRARLGPRHLLPGAEAAHGREPLRLDGRVRGQHQARRADAARQLHAEQGLARPRRRDDVGVPAASLAVALERFECELLVATPGAGEPEPCERLSRRARRPRRGASPAPRAGSSRRGSGRFRRAGSR